MKDLRSWVEIDTEVIKHNIGVFREIAGESRLMAVVKSNAYGHGMLECAKIFEKELAPRSSKSEVGWLGVDDIDEALALRRAGLTLPILVLGYTLPGRFAEATGHNLSLTIASPESLKAIRDSKFKVRDLKIHLKLETGLNRQGITEKELPETINILTFLGMLECRVEAVYSHFAADAPARLGYCKEQMKRFERMAGEIEKAFGHRVVKHMADSAASVFLPQARYDLVRIGIGLYGLDPASDVERAFAKRNKLKPVLSWYSIVAQVKGAKKGERVGYDLTEKLAGDSRLAVVPVGYWHGYPRSASGGSGEGALRRLAPRDGGSVLVRGKRCRIIGRISMDMMTIDVTAVPGVKAGEIVTLIGPGLSAEEVAAKANTINYEIVTRINQQIPRIYN